MQSIFLKYYFFNQFDRPTYITLWAVKSSEEKIIAEGYCIRYDYNNYNSNHISARNYTRKLPNATSGI